MIHRFGSKELAKCLTCLGFKASKEARGSHQKYHVPQNHSFPKEKRPFIIVILGKKHYCDQTSAKYIAQIKALNFSEEQIEKCLSK